MFWGDQHLHTSWSGDAAASGTRVGPNEALRLARGEEITSSTGQPVRLSRPLDWLAVSDHSDALGMINGVIAGDPQLLQDPVLKEWNGQMNAGGEAAMGAVMDIIARQSNGTLPEAMTDRQAAFDMWREMTKIIESTTIRHVHRVHRLRVDLERRRGDNLHRNVIYRDGRRRPTKCRRLPPSTARTRKVWDVDGGLRGRRPAARRWPSRTTATSPMGGCSRCKTFAGGR